MAVLIFNVDVGLGVKSKLWASHTLPWSDVIAVLGGKKRIKICSTPGSLGRRNNCPSQPGCYRFEHGVSLMAFGWLLPGLWASQRRRSQRPAGLDGVLASVAAQPQHRHLYMIP